MTAPRRVVTIGGAVLGALLLLYACSASRRPARVSSVTAHDSLRARLYAYLEDRR